MTIDSKLFIFSHVFTNVTPRFSTEQSRTINHHILKNPYVAVSNSLSFQAKFIYFQTLVDFVQFMQVKEWSWWFLKFCFFFAFSNRFHIFNTDIALYVDSLKKFFNAKLMTVLFFWCKSLHTSRIRTTAISSLRQNCLWRAIAVRERGHLYASYWPVKASRTHTILALAFCEALSSWMRLRKR